MKKKLLLLFTVLNLSVWSQSSDHAALYSLRFNSLDNTYNFSLLKNSVPSYDFTSVQKFSNAQMILFINKNENPSRKSPWLAFGLSFLFPGLGQLYNEEYGKTILMGSLGLIGLGAVALAAASTNFDSESNPNYIGVIFYSGLAVYGGVYIWSMIDAPISASNINERNTKLGIKIFSLEDERFVLGFRNGNKIGNYSFDLLVNF